MGRRARPTTRWQKFLLFAKDAIEIIAIVLFVFIIFILALALFVAFGFTMGVMTS